MVTHHNVSVLLPVSSRVCPLALLLLILRSDTLDLQLIVTGSHLDPNSGNSINDIYSDNIPISYLVDMLVVGDTPSSVSKSIALGTSGFTDAFANLKPHAVILLGDRYELCAAIPALISNIPLLFLYELYVFLIH